MNEAPATINLALLTGPVMSAGQQCRTFADSIRSLLQVTCGNDSQANWCGMEARRLANLKDAYTAQRNGGLEPARMLLAWIESLFPADAIKAIDEVIEHLKSIAFDYTKQQRAAAMQAAALATTPAEVQRSVQAAVQVPAGFDERETWGWELVDATQVPREYWVLDTKRLDKEAKKAKANLRVGGIRPKMTSSFARAARR